MNWRYVYIGSVAVLSYVLFLSWNAEKEIKQEFAEATFIERNNSEKLLPRANQMILFKSKMIN